MEEARKAVGVIIEISCDFVRRIKSEIGRIEAGLKTLLMDTQNNADLAVIDKECQNLLTLVETHRTYTHVGNEVMIPPVEILIRRLVRAMLKIKVNLSLIYYLQLGCKFKARLFDECLLFNHPESSEGFIEILGIPKTISRSGRFSRKCPKRNFQSHLGSL